MDFELRIDHCHRVLAHAAGADRVVDRVGVLPNPVRQLRVGRGLGGGRPFLADFAQGRLRQDALALAHALQQLRHVFGV